MASIERTAYPRFKRTLTAKELHEMYTPTTDERSFVERTTRSTTARFGLMVLLKVFQRLGYFPPLTAIPPAILAQIRTCLHLPSDTPLRYAHPRTLYRHHHLIRTYLGITPYDKQAGHVAAVAMQQAAQVMDTPADLINVAIEELIRQRIELPAFSTLDRLARRIRTLVNRRIFQQVLDRLSPGAIHRFDDLLESDPRQRRSPFNRLKELPKRATLSHIQEWQAHLDWLRSLGRVDTILEPVPPAKRKHFAAEAKVLDADDMRKITLPKRLTLLACLIANAQTTTQDSLIEMFLKRMARMHQQAKTALEQVRVQHQAIAEHLLDVFAEVVQATEMSPDDAALGYQVRDVLAAHGGMETLREHYATIAAYHGNNYLPLLPKAYRSYRRTLFGLVRSLDLRSTTQDSSVLVALQVLLANEQRRTEVIPASVSVDFASEQWQRTIVVRHQRQTMFNRRLFEICVFTYLAAELKRGDLCVQGSEKYADYRDQLLPWDECEPLVADYCTHLGFATTAEGFVQALQAWLTEVADMVDRTYPTNGQLVINEQGEPTLKRLVRKEQPHRRAALEAAMADRMPERNVIDTLCLAQHAVNWSRHFGPPSGAEPKLEQATEKYLMTVFGYGCNLGPTQTARHTRGRFTAQMLAGINRQHVTTPKLEAALRDLINSYNGLRLPKFWGTGKTAAADGTKYDLYEENLLAEYSIRYGGYGGIAYHHVADSYVALFSHFIACGVWEAIYIIDGLLKNTSDIQPDTIHADTHGQALPVFAFAHLLGIKLLPRIRNWKDLIMYRPRKDARYEHIDALFGDAIDWHLIAAHWRDMLQVMLSIKAGTIFPSTILRKLGQYSRKNRLYQAFRELGRVIRTIVLLRYISELELREAVLAATNKVEAYHGFAAWLFFGGDGVITDNDPEEQEKRIKYRDLVANAVILQNTIDMTGVLRQLRDEGFDITHELVAVLSPYLTRHIKRFGDYVIDMSVVPSQMEEDLQLSA